MDEPESLGPMCECDHDQLNQHEINGDGDEVCTVPGCGCTEFIDADPDADVQALEDAGWGDDLDDEEVQEVWEG